MVDLNSIPSIPRVVFVAAVERGLEAATHPRTHENAGWLRLRAETATYSLMGDFERGPFRCPLASIGLTECFAMTDFGFTKAFDNYLDERLEQMGEGYSNIVRIVD